jgi:hypothetical protein
MQAELEKGLLVHVGWPFAALAEPSGEPLGDDAVHGRGREKGFDSHAGQARNGGRGVVGVEGGQDEVSRERRLDTRLGGLAVLISPIITTSGSERRMLLSPE